MTKLSDRTARRTVSVRRKIKLAGIKSGRARLSVFRSSKHIHVQLIDDLKGETLAAASSLEKTMDSRSRPRAIHPLALAEPASAMPRAPTRTSMPVQRS